MKLAVVQYELEDDPQKNLSTAEDMARRAAADGADVICMTEHFLGEDPVPEGDVVSWMCGLSRQLGSVLISGKLTGDDGAEWVVAVDPEGHTLRRQQRGSVAAQPELGCFPLEGGRMVLLSGADAFNPQVSDLLYRTAPEIAVMQISARSFLEYEAFSELAINRSLGACTVCVLAATQGSLGGQPLAGKSIVAMSGEIVGEAIEHNAVLAVDIDPEQYVRYAELREPVAIPELLLQKFASENRRPGALGDEGA